MSVSRNPPSRGGKTSPKVIVIGLDCADPHYVFNRFRNVMPCVSGLMAEGTWGSLRSTIPPITVPAWASMVSGRDPGELGLYGFRDRCVGRYNFQLIDASSIKHPRVWDYLGRAGKRVAVLFVPPSYPPSKVNGELVSCFLTPGVDSTYTYPEFLKEELRSNFGDYLIDIEDFRQVDRSQLIFQLKRMAEQHFAIAEYIWRTRRPDFLMMVEIGTDRINHAFLGDLDSRHPNNKSDRSIQHIFQDYFSFLDGQISKLLHSADENTTVFVVSDHGARVMQGGICINQWLIEKGYLVLNRYPSQVTRFDQLDINWRRTQAWGEGGYYARVFINVEGREPHGIVPSQKVEEERDRLVDALQNMIDPAGELVNNRIYIPNRCYRMVRGTPADIMVFLGDLAYRSIGSVGHSSVFIDYNDQGMDGCNHDWEGIFLMSGSGVPRRGHVEGYAIYDMARTILGLMNVAAPNDLLGVDRSS